MKYYGLLLLHLFLCINAKLVFPPNSDVGYIVPDEPLPFYDDDIVQPHPSGKSSNSFSTKILLKYFNDKYDSSQSKGALENDIPENIRDPKHGVRMGIKSHKCDDGEIGLKMDDDGSPHNYICNAKNNSLPLKSNLESINICELIQPYTQRHVCMNKPITYNTNIPTFGDHRPLWPVYGEYSFLPTQRWLHSIEHGAIVMLYHPCAKAQLVEQLRSIVKRCLFRYIITPLNTLSPKRPLALAAWGCKMEMGYVDKDAVESFIKTRALKGPEGFLDVDGQFDHRLLSPSSIVTGSDHKDSILCP